MSKQAVSIRLTDDERIALERTIKARTATQREVARARVILMAEEGRENKMIAEQLSLSSHSVAVWRNRFAVERIAGLTNRPKTRTPIKYTSQDRQRVVEIACTKSPEAETHWSVRTLAKATGVGRETVRSILKDAHLRPPGYVYPVY